VYHSLQFLAVALSFQAASQYYIDVAYCYIDGVAWSVSQSVSLSDMIMSPAKNG